MCTGNSCVDQHRNTVTRQEAPADPEAERRLAALEQLGEKTPRRPMTWVFACCVETAWCAIATKPLNGCARLVTRDLVEAQFAVGRIYLMGFEEMGADPAEAEAWLTRAAAQGHKEALRLLPQAQAAKTNEHANYQVREADASRGAHWAHSAAPYYWHWRDSRLLALTACTPVATPLSLFLNF